MLSDFGHFIGVRGDGNQSDFRTFTCYSDNIDLYDDIGDIVNGYVVNASQVFDHCGCVKPRDRFIIYPKLDGVVHPTATYATCIEATKTNGIKSSRCYLIPHKENEFVAFRKINNLGTLDGGVVGIHLPCLGRVRTVGIIACGDLESEQVFDIRVSEKGKMDGGIGLDPKLTFKFLDDDAENTVAINDCDCLCSRVVISNDNNDEDNPIEAIAFCIYEKCNMLELVDGSVFLTYTGTGNVAGFGKLLPTTFYAKLKAVTCTWLVNDIITGNNKFNITADADENTPLVAAPVSLGDAFEVNEENAFLAGRRIFIYQSVADSTNARVGVHFRLYFDM